MNQLAFDTRASDPPTSTAAAAVARRGRAELIGAIAWWLRLQREPRTAFDVANAIAGARWSNASVRTALHRVPNLIVVDELGVTPRGRRCQRYVLGGN